MMPINLLPWREARQKRHIKCFYVATTLGFFTLLFSSWLVRHWIIVFSQQLRDNNHQTTQKIMTIQSKLPSTMTIKKIKQETTLLKNTAQQNQQLFNGMLGISEALPTHAYVTQLEYHNPLFLLQGHADNTHTITTFIRHLNQINTLKNVTLTSVMQKKNNAYVIQVQLQSLKTTPP